MSYIERQIIITITLQQRFGAPNFGIAANANPTFTDANGNETNSPTVKISGGGPAKSNGLRISARITRPGGATFGTADVQIYNLPLSIANQISTLGVPLVYMVGRNLITIQAGDVGSPPTTLFNGTIQAAWVDNKVVPDPIFNISAQSIGLYGSAPGKAACYAGSSPISTILGNIAPFAGLKLVNLFNGNTTEPQLTNQPVSGSFRDQIRKLAKNAGINYDIDDVNGLLIIGPKNSSLSQPGAAIPITGPPPVGNLVGYPSYTAQGIKITTEFSQAIGYGTTVIIDGSSMIGVNGKKWTVYYLDYDLECQAENGPWFTNLEMAPPGFPVLAQSSAP